jgi:hypothetical protein
MQPSLIPDLDQGPISKIENTLNADLDRRAGDPARRRPFAGVKKSDSM